MEMAIEMEMEMKAGLAMLMNNFLSSKRAISLEMTINYDNFSNDKHGMWLGHN